MRNVGPHGFDLPSDLEDVLIPLGSKPNQTIDIVAIA
jgi:hypothetical protein